MNVKISCDDGNECTIDRCNCESGCEHFPVDPKDHEECSTYQIPECKSDDDCEASADKCSVSYCHAGKCSAKAEDCNDHDDCTVDHCVSDKGCVYYPAPCYKSAEATNSVSTGAEGELVEEQVNEEQTLQVENNNNNGDNAIKKDNLPVGAIVGMVVAGVAIVGATSLFIGFKLKNRSPSAPDSYNSM